MPERLRVGVVGVGSLGQHHARVLADLEGAVLTAVHDHSLERARGVAERHGATACAELQVGEGCPAVLEHLQHLPETDHARLQLRREPGLLAEQGGEPR